MRLLGSCFEEREDRPAEAAVLVEKLAALLKPPVVQPNGPSRSWFRSYSTIRKPMFD